MNLIQEAGWVRTAYLLTLLVLGISLMVWALREEAVSRKAKRDLTTAGLVGAASMVAGWLATGWPYAISCF